MVSIKTTIKMVDELLGRPLDITLYKDRLLLQKIVYMLQKGFDYPSDYHFSWYVKGPYSSTLSNNAFKYLEGKKRGEIDLKSKERKIIKKMKATFLKENIDSPDNMELYASVMFLVLDEGVGINEKSITEKMSLLKPWFSENQVKKALKKITPICS